MTEQNEEIMIIFAPIIFIINFVNISTMKTLKNVSLKRELLLLSAGAFTMLCTFNVKLGLSDYDKSSIVSSTKEALATESGDGSSASCLVNANPSDYHRSKSSGEMGSSVYCYKKRATGPDLYQGKILGCVSTNYVSSCIAKTCSSSGCYVSNQAPSSDNY
jgi:hypothetical protein